MATADCNDELTYVCEECYRFVYTDCETITISVGLDPETEYCIKFYDKFGTTYQFLVTTDISGDFVIDETELPNKFFNQFSGLVELQIFADCDTTTRVQFTVAYTQYNCLLLENSLAVEDNDNIDTPGNFSYVAVTDNGVTINVPCDGAYTCEVIPCEDATVENSDTTYSDTVASGATLVLPDITLTQPNGDIENHPSVKNLVCDTEAVVIENADFDIAANFTALRANVDWQSNILVNLNTAEQAIVYNDLPIAYNWPAPTGQTTSYTTGDDAYYWTNLWQPLFATAIVGKRPQLADFTTLISNNAFGNTNRFTDELGTQLYANNYLIDHYTGLGWYILVQSAANWANSIAAAEAFSTLFSDWFVPNQNQQASIANFSLSDPLNFAPFNLASTSIKPLWASTTSPAKTTFANCFFYAYTVASDEFSGGRWGRAKTDATVEYLLCRKHF